jgi:hypothetical protein
MHKNATKCKQNIKQLVQNKHGASKIIDTFATYQIPTDRYLEMCFNNKGSINISIIGLSFKKIIYDKCLFNHIGKY